MLSDFRLILPVVFIPAKFVYLVAGLCGLYLSVAPFFTSIHGYTFLMAARWMGTLFLLVAAAFPSTRTTNIVALVGSTITIASVLYVAVRLIELKLGIFHGVGRVVEYQPTMFDRFNRIVSKPVLLLFLVSSLASLLISALITMRSGNRTAAPLAGIR